MKWMHFLKNSKRGKKEFSEYGNIRVVISLALAVVVGGVGYYLYSHQTVKTSIESEPPAQVSLLTATAETLPLRVQPNNNRYFYIIKKSGDKFEVIREIKINNNEPFDLDLGADAKEGKVCLLSGSSKDDLATQYQDIVSSWENLTTCVGSAENSL